MTAASYAIKEEQPIGQETTQQEQSLPPTKNEPDTRGFAEFLKKKKPFVGGIIESMEMKTEGDTFILFLDKKYSNFVKNEQEEIKSVLKEYFGKEMIFTIKEGAEKKKDLLEEYVKEAESLFNL